MARPTAQKRRVPATLFTRKVSDRTTLADGTAFAGSYLVCTLCGLHVPYRRRIAAAKRKMERHWALDHLVSDKLIELRKQAKGARTPLRAMLNRLRFRGAMKAWKASRALAPVVDEPKVVANNWREYVIREWGRGDPRYSRQGGRRAFCEEMQRSLQKDGVSVTAGTIDQLLKAYRLRRRQITK